MGLKQKMAFPHFPQQFIAARMAAEEVPGSPDPLERYSISQVNFKKSSLIIISTITEIMQLLSPAKPTQRHCSQCLCRTLGSSGLQDTQHSATSFYGRGEWDKNTFHNLFVYCFPVISNIFPWYWDNRLDQWWHWGRGDCHSPRQYGGVVDCAGGNGCAAQAATEQRAMSDWAEEGPSCPANCGPWKQLAVEQWCSSIILAPPNHFQVCHFVPVCQVLVGPGPPQHPMSMGCDKFHKWQRCSYISLLLQKNTVM